MHPRSLLLATLFLAACGGSDAAPTTFMRVPVDGAPQRGPADAWVTVVEFGDFQCPACKVEAPALDDVLASYGADARLVFRHFPLQRHAFAHDAAVAADCAGAQGRFWEMHDALFARSPQLDGASLSSAASDAGVADLGAWNACVASADAAARVAADVALGTSAGVQGTPTLVVNGTPLLGALPDADLRAAIDAALAAAQKSGIPRDRYYDTAVLGR